MLGWLGLGGSPTGIPYDLGESISYSVDYWSLHEGTSKDKEVKETVTIFKFHKSDKAVAMKLSLAKQGWARLRTMKHPTILTYISGSEQEDAILLATEPAVPLDHWLKKQQDTSQAITVDELTWGFKCLLEALNFVHTKCNLVHGLLSPSAVFVCQNGDWKLGLFDLACNLSNSDEEQIFKQFEHLQATPYRSPERRSNTWESKGAVPMDIYSLVQLFQYCLDQTRVETPSLLEPIFKKMLSAESGRRPVCAAVLRCPLFMSSYITVLELLTEISMKTPQESVELMASITKAEVMPRTACQHKVLPFVGRNMMIAVNDFQNRDCRESCRSLAASSLSLLETFITKEFIEEEMFSKHIVPALISLWGIADRAIRTTLLKSLRALVKVTPTEIINKSIFDPLLSGFADSNAKMREETLKNLVYVVDKLEERLLQDKLVRCVTNLQGDQEASIRTNSTIFLGKISPKLKEAVRLRILCTAFTKSMRDSFVHCRIAGLKAAISCMSYFDVPQISTKLLPQVTCMLTDPAGDVRDLAIHFIEAAMPLMKEYNQAMKDEALSNASKQSLDRTLERSDSGSGSTLANWTSWAVGGLTKVASDSSVSAENSTTTTSQSSFQSTSQSSSVIPSKISSNSTTSASAATKETAKKMGLVVADDGDDQWDDMDGLNIDDDDDDENNDIGLPRRSSKVSHTDTSSKSHDEGWGQDDDLNWSDSGSDKEDKSKVTKSTASSSASASANALLSDPFDDMLTTAKQKTTTTKGSISLPAKTSNSTSLLSTTPSKDKKTPVKATVTVTKLKTDDEDWDF